MKTLGAVFFLTVMVGMLALLGLVRVRPLESENLLNPNLMINELGKKPLNLNQPVVDLSGWQPPKTIDYDLLSQQIIGAVIRVNGSYGYEDTSANKQGEDKAYKQHIKALQERGIPVAVYAFVTGKTELEMRKQARDFYHRASPFKPTYYWLDVEVTNMKDMNRGIEAFRSELAQLGAKNIGIYAQDWFLKTNKISVDKFSALWIAAYGRNTGAWDASPETSLNYGMHQYTDKGELAGYSGNLDLNLVVNLKTYDKYFKNE